MLPTPSEDTVSESRRAIWKYDNDKNNRDRQRLKMARAGLLMVAPGRW